MLTTAITGQVCFVNEKGGTLNIVKIIFIIELTV